ncbi:MULTISPECIES: FkbM family methyltransferase [Synechococcales]|uniref:FkbM family methyltransferase n=1 Tax=Synechococcus sp. CS-1324 TaxID=2847980 RepID=UPI00223AE921|nr:FkbM family methyltransferase [Synechococcus sp. CS-1324]
MVQNCRANPQLNISALNLALGAHSAQIAMTALPESGINHIHREPSDSLGPTQSAFQLSLDQLKLSDLSGLHGKLVIKIDVEHHELEVLRGASETLRINQPLALCIEAAPNELAAIIPLLGSNFQPIEPPYHPGFQRSPERNIYNHFFVNQLWQSEE